VRRVVAAIGLAATLFCCRDAGPGAAPELLRAALRGYRPLEPRLSLDLGYAPCRQAPGTEQDRVRCAELPAARSRQGRELQVAVAACLRSLRRAPPTSARRRRALLGLISGTENGATHAVADLEAAVGTDPRETAAWSDLAAGYLMRARFRAEPYDLLRALAAAQEAVAAAPPRPAARFNLALVLEELGLRASAAAAWRRFLAAGREPGWAEEAAAHLAALARPAPGFGQADRSALRMAAMAGNGEEVSRLAVRSPQAAREVASEELLPDWGAALLHGDLGGADHLLAGASSVGQALQALGGDETVTESVRVIERTAARGGPDLHALALAHADYGQGLRQYRSLRVEDAGKRLRRASRALTTAGSPMALWAESLMAGIDLSLARQGRAAVAFAALLSRAGPDRMPALRGRLCWGLGLVRVRQGRLTEALTWYGQAVSAFRLAQEAVNQARVEALTAEALKYLGEEEAAWAHRRPAMAVLANLPASRDLHGALWEAADALLEQRRPALALVFQQDDVELARRSGDPFLQAEALLRLARVLAALDRSGEALQALAEARTWNARGGSAVTAAGTGAQIDLEEGELLRRREPAAAERLAGRAVVRLTALRRPLEARLAYLSRARARLAAGNEAAAEADLDAALRLVGRQQAAIAEPGFRESFAAAAQRFFDEWIMLRSRRSHAELATLEAVERARSLASVSFTDPAGAGGTRHGRPMRVGLAAELAALPADVAVIELGVVGDRLFRWTLRRRGVELAVRSLERTALAEGARRFAEAVRRGAGRDEIAQASAPLFPLLVPAGGSGVGPGERLVFVPDGELHQLPFAALVDPRAGRFLVEDHVVSVAPSASSYLEIVGRRVPPGLRGWSALLVADPQFDPALFPEMDRLTGAQQETSVAGALFPASRVLAGKQATRARLLQEAGRHEILGFAGHAVANQRLPFESYLVLAPAAGDSGRLFARQLVGTRFAALRLVVLSACQTATGMTRGRGMGLLGLTGPFLQGGAAAVVATLWRVDDAAAAALVADFYRRFRESGDAAAALRGAQMAMLKGAAGDEARSPAGWAGFQVVGELRAGHSGISAP
jgi:tetratricopeptide (TPR) repeat protein